MSGNAMEEGLLLQIHNPSHLDPARLGFLVGAVAGFVALLGISAVLPWLPRLIAVYFALAVVAGVGTVVTMRITATRKRHEVDVLMAARARDEAETRRQIAEMKRA